MLQQELADLSDGEDEDEIIEEFKGRCPLAHSISLPLSDVSHESNLAISGTDSYSVHFVAVVLQPLLLPLFTNVLVGAVSETPYPTIVHKWLDEAGI